MTGTITARNIIDAMATGRSSVVEQVEQRLEAIAQTDHLMKAWVVIDAHGARAAARRADERRARGDQLPLDGVTFAVKDVIDQQGLPTACGFAPFVSRIAAHDAAVVARLRAAGAIPLGKVATAQFAVSDPPDTVSPWDPALTPGGSSTGSGVAVALGHVPWALGTQTGGSILRPAAYNGVVGFKPTFDAIATAGVVPTAWSLDHLGVLASSVDDAVRFAEVVFDRPGGQFGQTARPDERPPTLGVVTEAIERADPTIAAATQVALERLVAAGANTRDVALPVSLEALEGVYRVIMQSEAVAVHARLFAQHRDAYGPQLRDYLDAGRLHPGWALVKAQRTRQWARKTFAGWLAQTGCDVLVLPVTPTMPPARATTGSSAFLAPFSLLGVPSASVPTVMEAELPQAVQLVASAEQDARLLAVAGWAAAQFDALPLPDPAPVDTAGSDAAESAP